MSAPSTPSGTSTAAPTPTWAVPARQAILVLTIASAAMIALGIGGPIRAAVSICVVLIAPGLAASFSMGPMSNEVRALISVVASVALVTAVSALQLAAGFWSPDVGFAMIALFTIGLTLFPIESGGTGGARYSLARSTDARPSETSRGKARPADEPKRGVSDDQASNDHD